MWSCATEQLDSRTHVYHAQRDGSPISYSDVLRFWCEDEGFRSFFIGLLAESPFSGYRWETPPVTIATANRPFEFVLLDAPGLNQSANRGSFGPQFRSAPANQQVVVFGNLGRDATLVVPCPIEGEGAYVHLATFVRQAPRVQVHELWRMVGMTMQTELGAKPVWLSTAGMGVSWLHVRLDSRPKYYGFGPYRVWT